MTTVLAYLELAVSKLSLVSEGVHDRQVAFN